MRILFMGTGMFAVPSLEALLKSGHSVVGIVTQPDRPAGRGRKLRVSPVKEVAENAGLPVYQPEKVRAEDFVSLVKEINPDCIVVAAFGQIIPKSILDIPRYGNVNVHGSLLPKYRGAAPVHYALFCGESRTGVTTMLMAEGLDTGPMLLKREVDILPDDNEGVLESRLASVGSELLIETLEKLESGSIEPIPQDDKLATYAPSVKKAECQVEWSKSAGEIANRVRGCTPRPGAYTFLNGSSVRLWSCKPVEKSEFSGNPGEVVAVDSTGIYVGTGCGILLITEIQPENKKRMDAVEFARGYRIAEHSLFEAAEVSKPS